MVWFSTVHLVVILCQGNQAFQCKLVPLTGVIYGRK